MISEPAHGSDALNMTTQHSQVNGKVSIKGKKHWQGLSGDADYWLVASRQAKESGGCSSQGWQWASSRGS